MKTSITKEEINHLPLFRFEGKVVLAATAEQISTALKEIQYQNLVGFDTESKPAYRKGQFNHVALIQIAIPGKVYLLRITDVGITEDLRQFLCDDKIIKIGIAIDDDLNALLKRGHFRPAGFVDLNKLAPELGFENIGARNLTAMVLGFRISKSQQTSNWESKVLTTPQIQYAATDAWVCLEVYKNLQQRGFIDE